MNHIVSGYIDDLYLQGSTYQKCWFGNPPWKICVYSTTENDFLGGFVIDSVRMIVILTEDKIHKLKDLLTFSMDNAHPLGFGMLLDSLAI